MKSKLALGTVQFGLSYGIANKSGRVSPEEAGKILDHAWAMGLDTLDTAAGYGDSEHLLGEIGVQRWQVVTKCSSSLDCDANVAGWVRQSVMGSLERLKVAKLHGLLLHRSADLLGPEGDEVYRALVDFRDNLGTVDRIGVSIYNPEELDDLCGRFQFDLIQAPYNIFDRRLATSGWLTRLHQAGTEVHVRSIFLQGLLLMNRNDRSQYFKQWQSIWDQWHGWLDAEALTPLRACLGFALSQSEIDRVVIGVDSLNQLQEILGNVGVSDITPPKFLICDDPSLINPGYWRAH